ncbi:hypothetical protein [Rhizobium leguminosarum]|nr:hypothetical protein [Rhizobium leguminosarum]
MAVFPKPAGFDVGAMLWLSVSGPDSKRVFYSFQWLHINRASSIWGRCMKRLISLLAIIGLLASVAIAEDADKGTVDLWIEEIRTIDPLLQAVLKDHMGEAREIDSMLQAGDDIAAQKAMAAVRWKFSNLAFSRASDATAIEVLKKSGEIADILSEQYPEGCLEFVRRNLSPKAMSILDQKQIYWNYLETQRLAYEDGKNREPVARMEVGTMFEVVTEDLGVSEAEIHMLLKPENIPAAQLCSIVKKNLNIEAVRESQRGPYARANISSKRIK